MVALRLYCARLVAGVRGRGPGRSVGQSVSQTRPSSQSVVRQRSDGPMNEFANQRCGQMSERVYE
eukprot:212483-Lingulodinium_polyedra.AAC.1